MAGALPQTPLGSHGRVRGSAGGHGPKKFIVVVVVVVVVVIVVVEVLVVVVVQHC